MCAFERSEKGMEFFMKKQKNIKIYIITIIILLLFSINAQANNETNIKAPESNSDSGLLADGTYIIKSAINNNYVLDVEKGANVSGANVQLYKNNETKSQRFIVKYLGNGYYTIKAAHSDKVLDVANGGKTAGTNVWQCFDNDSDAQKWIIKESEISGYYYIVSKCNDLYLDVANGIAANGTNIAVCYGNNSNAQKFKFEEYKEPEVEQPSQTIVDGTYVIKSAINNNYVVDVAGGSNTSGANIQLYQNEYVDNQKFIVKYLENGYYTIKAEHSNKVMDVANGGKTAGTNVWQCYENNSDAQKWIIKESEISGYYYIISKCNGLYLDVANGIAANGTNIAVCYGNNSTAQKFKFEKYEEQKQLLENGTYTIETGISGNYVLDVLGSSQTSGANLQIYQKQSVNRQKFKVIYLGNGDYTIIAVHSNQALDVANAGQTAGTNVWQCYQNDSNAQKWKLKDAGNGYFYIISKCNGLYLDVANGIAENGTNVTVCYGNNSKAQKFKFVEPVDLLASINTTKYPGYKEKIAELMKKHPNWNFELLYTGLKFSDVIVGESKVHSTNLVPVSYTGEWLCTTCGTTSYDSGWYCASQKAIAYYMDPRNFLDEINVFQFQDVNQYIAGVCTLEGIQLKVKGTFLQNYATDIDNACRNQNVNSYYIIARVLQEQGVNGTTIGTGMDGGDGKIYYNPFNIGASGNGYDEIYANALARAKSYGWDTMQKALEGGITFCKQNWLENYQNTLYQNKFDIDIRSGASLYTHQYMQNLMAAYSEARTMRNMYSNTNKIDSYFTFIIPMYEDMSATVSLRPVDSQEIFPIDVQVTSNNGLWIRQEPSENSQGLRVIGYNEIILSVQRANNWHKVITQDGLIGYMSGSYLKQVEDQRNCNYTAMIKTNDGTGCNIRIGPSTKLDKISFLKDGTVVTVINEGTYNNINGHNWCRIILSDGRQAFMSTSYLERK